MGLDVPCVVAYDHELKELLIGILRVNSAQDDYLASLDPSKRHPLLPRVASTPHLVVDPVYHQRMDLRPTAAAIISGFSRNGRIGSEV